MATRKEAVIAIAGGKGGCGKTTTAIGVAAALAAAGRRARVVDLDIDMPNVHRVASVDRTPTITDLNERSLAAVAHQSPKVPGVDVLTAPRHGRVPDYDRLAATLGDSMPTILDCPCGAGPDAVAPLVMAESVVIVLAPTHASVQDAIKTEAMASTLGTPVGAVVIVGTRRPPAGVTAPFQSQQVQPIPAVEGDPLIADASTRAYRRVAEALLETTTISTRAR